MSRSVVVDPVEDFLAIDPVAEVHAAAEPVQPERIHGDDQVRREAAEENRPARVARAGAAALVAGLLKVPEQRQVNPPPTS